MSVDNPHKDKVYLENRRRLLASKPMCHWCNRRKATTADHLIEVDRGGGHEMDNLVPACLQCNSRRGQAYVTAKKNATKKAREAGVKKSEAARGATVFGETDLHPKPSMLRLSQGGSEDAGTARDALEGPQNGVGAPRLVTALYGGSTYGDAVARWSQAVLGVELMPWQVLALQGQLEHHEGVLRRRSSLVSVARQNGKTVALSSLIGWWLTEGAIERGGPQTVISTAHALDLATALFQTLAPVLEAKFGAKAKWSYGRQELLMPDGSVWLVRAATPAAGHGRSPDLIVADEVWDISEEVIDQGLMPSQRARRSPLFSAWSTAGTEASRWMARFREQGLRQIDDGGAGPMFFAEWSVDPSVGDVNDPQHWSAANPAIGYTIDLETLIAESKTPNRSAFLRASLNMWVSADAGWLEPGVWEKAKVDLEQLPTGTVLAIDSSLDESRYAGLLACPMDDGRVVVTPVIHTNNEAELWDAVRDKLPPGAMLAVTPGLEVHCPLEYKKRTTVVGYAEMVRWTSLVRGMVQEGRVCHTGEQALTEQVCRAVASRTQQGLVLSSNKSPGPIELARMMVWAVALATKSKWSARPTIASSRR